MEVIAERMSEAELAGWGERIGREAEVPVVLGLRGPLGAGKSVLARAIARGAGVGSPIPSPTFNLLFRYRGDRRVDVVHVDLFRIARQDEIWELGWAELGKPDEILLIEWPERAEAFLPADRWDVYLSIPRGAESFRRVRLVRQGEPSALPLPSPATAAIERVLR